MKQRKFIESSIAIGTENSLTNLALNITNDANFIRETKLVVKIWSPIVFHGHY